MKNQPSAAIEKGIGISEEYLRRRSSVGSLLRSPEPAQKLHENPEALPKSAEIAASGERMGCAWRTSLLQNPSCRGCCAG
jgi:hypothetical protein